ncbi:MAG: restriction endonuclease subunit S [Defluviitaleaceae bacterium]|nr:restriction endonuclease subunit S [Defluviitaleaceae bacterium]
MGEVAKVVGGGTPDTNIPEYWGGEIDWYAPAEIGEQIYVTDSKRKITTLGLQKSSATMLPIGTVLFTSRAGIGNTAILGKESATNQGFQSIVPHCDKLNSYFIYSRTHELKRYGEMVGAGSTFVEVSGKQMANMPLNIPSLSEQTAIGSFFRSLDNAIHSHQQKLNHLRELKKGYLQLMFPQDGEAVPKVRFAGFTGDWTQRKLGEVLEISSASRVHKGEWTKEGVPFFRSSDVTAIFTGKQNTKAFISYEHYKSLSVKSGKVKKHDVLATGGGSIAIPYLVPNDEPLYFKDADLIWMKTNENLEGQFLYNFFTSPMLRNYVQTISHVGTISHYIIEQAKDTPITLPSLTEQTAVGVFFRTLGNQITAQAQKLEQLKQLKAAYLQKMFM